MSSKTVNGLKEKSMVWFRVIGKANKIVNACVVKYGKLNKQVRRNLTLTPLVF
jgi:hypothetical protein